MPLFTAYLLRQKVRPVLKIFSPLNSNIIKFLLTAICIAGSMNTLHN